MASMPARLVVTVALVVSAHAALAQGTEIGPPPGRLVDVGGRRLHLHCTGNGAPTVIIEAGASAFAIDFTLVQPDIAKITRTCSYDRAGSGWSDPRPDVETPRRIIEDLHTLLERSREQGPFVLVGHSRGGVLVRLYQAQYPRDVVGMVLIDPTVEDRLYTMFQGNAVAIASLTPEQHRSIQPTAPVSVPSRPPQTGAPFDRLPADVYATRVALDRRLIASVPSIVSAEVVGEFSIGEYEMLTRLNAARKAAATLLGDLPLLVLTRGDGPAGPHAELARMSSAGRHLVVENAYHEIHLSHPDVVVKGVADIIAQVRTRAAR